jgi:NAD(P)-dependent dehydrogenase (short-subunit alcohol dehydrogenase family)
MDHGVTGKVVIVTGASQGIGEATARRFAEEGARLVLSDVTAEVVGVAADIANRLPSSAAIGVVTDPTDPDACDSLVAKSLEHHGGLDVLIVATGVLPKKGPLAELAPAEWDRVMQVNAKGPFLFCRSAIPVLPRPGGAIVLLASFAGLEGQADYAVYSASKGAVRLLAQSLALELAADGIRVNAIAPAYVESALGRQAVEVAAAAEAGKSIEEIRAKRDLAIPLRRQAAAREVADAMLFLGSPAASYVTGTCLDVSGGVIIR